MHDKRIRVAVPGVEARVAAYLAISIHPSLSSLCTTDYRFAKLTFLWWNNGVARADGEEDRSRARKTSGDAHAETREDQFDVNRSIVIRVNRLPLFVDSPRRPVEYNSRFVLLYFIPRVVEECRCCDGLQVSTVAYYEKLRSPVLLTKRET